VGKTVSIFTITRGGKMMINAMQILESKDSKVSFMKGIIELAKVAGIDQSEIIYFQKAMETLGLPEEVKQNIEKLLYSEKMEVELNFKDKKEELFFIRECIQLCYVDGHYHEEEKMLIRKMTEQLNIRIDSLEKIEEWVLEGIEWSNRGEELLYLEV
jgi:hypothetical protein